MSRPLRRRLSSLVTITALAAAALVQAPPASGADPGPGVGTPLPVPREAAAVAPLAVVPAGPRPTVTRLDAAGPVAMSASFAKARWPQPFPQRKGTVYLAPTADPALVATAGSLPDGPMLFVPRCGPLPAAVRDEIARLRPAQVTALGAESDICTPLLQAAAGLRVASRVDEHDRYSMSLAIASRRAAAGPVTEVYLAGGSDPTSAALAGTLRGGPTIVVDGTEQVQARARAMIGSLGPVRVVALGGSTALPQTWVDAVAAGRATGRLGGSDPVQTSAAIVAHQHNETVPRLYLVGRYTSLATLVATGMTNDGPTLMLPPQGPLAAATTAVVTTLRPREVTVVSPSNALPDAQVQAALSLVPDVGDGVVIRPGVHTLTDAERAAIVSYDAATGRLLLRRGQLSAATFALGDVLTSVPGPVTPDGLLRRIVDIRVTPAGVVLRTVAAGLDEVLESTDGPVTVPGQVISESVEPAPGVTVLAAGGQQDEAASTRGNDPVSPAAVGGESTTAISLSFSASTPGDGPLTGTGKLALTGELVHGVTSDLTVEQAAGWGLERLRLELRPYARSSVGLSASGELTGSRSVPLAHVQRVLLYMVGPVPLVVITTGEVTAKLEAGLEGTLHLAKVEGTVDALIGFDHNRGRTVPLYDLDPGGSVDTLEADASATVKATVGVTVEASAYGLLGIEVMLGAFGEGIAQLDDGANTCTAQAGLEGHAALVAGGTFFGVKLESRFEQSHQSVIAKTSGPCTQTVIRFDEFPLGTPVSDQYADKGVLVSGTNAPVLSRDSANPTAPVLSPGPGYTGGLELRMVEPKAPHDPATVGEVSFDIGYIDRVGPTVTWFDSTGEQLGSIRVQGVGIVPVTLPGPGIARVVIEDPGDDAGYALDNLALGH